MIWKHRSAAATGVAAAAAILATSALTPARASSHREAPAIAEDPTADNTDVWAWVTPGSRDMLHVVASWIPLEEPSGGPNFYKFSDEVRYEIKIAKGANDLKEDVVYRFKFDTSKITRVDPADLSAPLGGGKEFFAQLSGQVQTYTVTRIEDGREKVLAKDVPVAPSRIGPRTYTIGQKQEGGPETYDDAYAATFITPLGQGGGDDGSEGGGEYDQGRVWAGPRDDGFYVDLGGIFDLANILTDREPTDGVSGFNTHTIALEIPLTDLIAGGAPATTDVNKTLGVYATASRRKMRVLRNNEPAYPNL